MSRWQPNARGRLMEAALDLYAERGYDATTTAAIAESAGLTERTFFRHFADKREVLFSGEADAAVLEALAADPHDATNALDVVVAALSAAADPFARRREDALRRRAVIEANPALVERELVKLARLAQAISDILRDRGVSSAESRLAAEVGVTIFKGSFDRWLQDGGRSFEHHLRTTLAELRTVTAESTR